MQIDRIDGLTDIQITDANQPVEIVRIDAVVDEPEGVRGPDVVGVDIEVTGGMNRVVQVDILNLRDIGVAGRIN